MLTSVMKRTFFLMFLIILSDIFLISESPDGIKLEEILTDFRIISTFEGHTEGSAQERQLVGYIRSRLPDGNIFPVCEYDFSDAVGFHSFSRILEVLIPGERADTLILAVPLSSPPGARTGEDGSVNIALALGVLRRYAEQRPPLTLRVVFIGADSVNGESLGTGYYLRTFQDDTPASVLYLSFRTFPSKIVLVNGGDGAIAPDWTLKRSSSALKAASLPFGTRGNDNQILRTGRSLRSSPLGAFLLAGIPGVALEGTRSVGRLPDCSLWISRFFHFFDTYLEANVSGFPDRWDHNHLGFQIGSNVFTIGEELYVLLLFSVLFTGAAYALVRIRRIRRYRSVLARDFWNLPVLYSLIFLLLLSATFLLEGFLRLRNFPSLWERLPLLYLVLKLSFAGFLFSLLLKALKIVPFSQNGSFYSSSAILFLLVDIVIVAVINISLTWYFLWAFIMAFCFSIPRSRYLKLAFFLLSPLPLVKVTVDLFSIPELEVCRAFLFSRFQGNLILAFFMLPFMLMIMRLDFMFRSPVKENRGFAAILTTSVSGLLILCLGSFLLLYSPYFSAPQPVTITETLDRDQPSHHVTFSSPAPLGDFTWRRADELHAISTSGRSYSLELSDIPQALSISTDMHSFLDRNRYRLTVTAERTKLHSISLELDSTERIVLYDTNFPYTLVPADNAAVIHIGSSPASPLEIEFTLPREAEVTLKIVVTSTGLSGEWSIPDRDFSPETFFVYRDSLTLPRRF